MADNIIDGPWKVEPPSDTEVVCIMEEPLQLDAEAMAMAAKDTAVFESIKKAAAERLDHVIILGIDKSGELFVEYDSIITSMEANWVLSTALFELKQQTYEEILAKRDS